MPAPQRKERPNKLRVVTDPKPSNRARRAKAIPDLVSLPAGTTNLPRELSGFIGRDREADELSELAGSSPLVTITGPSGIGKTRLALHVAARLAQGYPDGVWLIELALTPAGDDPAVVAEVIAAVLDVRPQPGRPLAAVLSKRLQGSSVLMVVDNCEHVGSATASVLEDLLKGCPHLTILATSQHPLGIAGEKVFNIGPLSLPEPGRAGAGSDAVALFYARAKAVQQNFVVTDDGAEAVAEICRRLDGIPLAVELAAARTAVLSPLEIVENLDARFGLLTRAGQSSTTTSRHQTLQSALDWSFDLLPPPEQALLRRLSVFAGGAGLREVREVCVGGDVAVESLVDLLSALVTKSLVVADTGRNRARYRLLETIRAYARDRLGETDEAGEICARHAEWFAGFGERAWHQIVVADQRGGADALEAEHDNLRVALNWFITNNKATAALRLGSALTPFWKRGGHFREGREWLDRALALPDAASSPSALRSRALHGVGLLATMQGDLERGSAALEDALDLARSHHHQRAAIQALNLLGFISVFNRDPATALPLLDESVRLARADGDASALISALALYGRAHLFLGNTAASQKVFEECRRMGQSYGDGDDSDGLIGLGWIALARGHHEEARAFMAEALPMIAEADDRFEMALIMSFLGELAWITGDNDEARRLSEEGLVLARNMGAPYPLARCLMVLGRLAHAAGDTKSALALTEEAVDAVRQARFAYALVRCLHARADLQRANGDIEGAEASYQEACDIASTNGDKAGTADSMRALATFERLRGDYVRATTLYIDALRLSVSADSTGGVADALEGLAAIAVAQERAEHAARLLGAANSFRSTYGISRSPAWQADYDLDTSLARAALPAATFEANFTQGGTMTIDDAAGLAMRSRGGRRRPGSGWAALTTTERQVVDLVGEGLSNTEIAERMFVSPRTVQGHISRVFGKLGISSRRDLREEWRQRQETT